MSVAAPRLLYVVTEDWYFLSHRLPLARAARDAGWEVHVATRLGGDAARIAEEGLRAHPVPFSRSPRRPWRDVASIATLVRLYRALAPDVVHHVALKPVVLGSIAAVAAPPPLVVNALTGLGFVFASRGRLARALRPPVRALLGVLLRRANAVTLVQNPDDRLLLEDAGLLEPQRTVLVRGSGVDLEAFRPISDKPAPPLVVLIGRMLRDKGVEEFIAAAELLHGRGVAARFALVGDLDPENPAGLPRARLEAAQAAGAVAWWGRRDDIPAVLAEAAVACLPSYREGLPKALLEAAAAGLPLVATDVPGCREVVVHGDNGLLVPPGDAAALADALQALIEDPVARARMGARSRARAAAFSVERVVADTLAVYARFGRMAAQGRSRSDA